MSIKETFILMQSNIYKKHKSIRFPSQLWGSDCAMHSRIMKLLVLVFIIVSVLVDVNQSGNPPPLPGSAGSLCDQEIAKKMDVFHNFQAWCWGRRDHPAKKYLCSKSLGWVWSSLLAFCEYGQEFVFHSTYYTAILFYMNQHRVCLLPYGNDDALLSYCYFGSLLRMLLKNTFQGFSRQQCCRGVGDDVWAT